MREMNHLNEAVFDSEPVRRLIELAVEEDLGAEGDVTSRVIPEETRCENGVIEFREPGVLAGLPLAERVLKRIAPEASFERTAHCASRRPRTEA